MKAANLVIGAMVALAGLSARADDTPAQCTDVEKGYSEAVMYSTQRQGQLAKQEEPLLMQMQKLNDLAKEPNVPIGKQLTPEQLDEFQKLRAQLVYLQTEAYVASSRERDMGILFHVCLASAESEKLMESYIADHDQLDDQYTTWSRTKYDKSESKQYLYLLDQLQSIFPTEFAKQLQEFKQLQQQGAGTGRN